MGRYGELLPIGSVVLLQGGDKRLMIVGRIQVRNGDPTVYDYSGIYYPEGVIGNDSLFFFNDDAIESVLFMGFQDREELEFRNRVLAELGELKVVNGEIVEV